MCHVSELDAGRRVEEDPETRGEDERRARAVDEEVGGRNGQRGGALHVRLAGGEREGGRARRDRRVERGLEGRRRRGRGRERRRDSENPAEEHAERGPR